MKPRRRWRRGAALAVPVLLVAVLLGSCGLQVSNTALPDATQSQPYTATLQAEGGKAPYSWALVAGSLPAGLHLDSSTGTVSGTPSAVGTSSFTAQVTDADAKTATQVIALQVVVPGDWPQADKGAGRRGWAGAEKGLTPANVGGIHEEWKLDTSSGAAVLRAGVAYVDGHLPGTNDTALMAVDVSNRQVLWSTPIDPNCVTGTVALTDAAAVSTCGTEIEAYRLAAPHDRLWTTADTDPGAGAIDLIVTGSLVAASANGKVTVYDATTGERQWQQLAPSGATVGSMAVGDGRVVVTFSDRIRAFDLADGHQVWQQMITTSGRIVVADGWIYTSSDGLTRRLKLADGTAGWTAPADPGGLSAEGVYAVDGTTVYSYWSLYDFGSDTLALRALHTTDGTQRWRQQLPSRLRSAAVVGDLVWTTTSEAGLYGGQAGQLTAWSPTDGTMLANVDFTTRVQAGTAFAGGHALVQANGLHEIGLGAPVPTITTKALRSGRVGTTYAEQLAAAGGTPPYTWSIASGSLPSGVTLASNGALSGPPTVAGAPAVTFRVTDAAGRSVTASLVVQIGATGGVSAWSTGRYDATHNAVNPAETGVGLDHAVQMANRWRTAANPGTSIQASDPISVGGRLYASGMDGVLRAWSATGTTTNRVAVWTASADPNEQFVSAPTESAGTLYVVGSDAAVYAIRASDGVRLWRQTTDPDVSQYASPVAAPLVVGGKVIVATYRPNLGTAGAWALSASTGALAWGGVAKDLTVPGVNAGVQLPAASDGSRLFVELGCEVEALDLGTGATAWTADVTYGTNGNCNPYSTTLVAPSVSNGVVYAGAWDATAAYDAATGAVRWKTHRGTTGGSPVLSNGVLVTQEINNVTEFGWGSVPVGLDARTGLLLWTADSGATGPASVSGDLVLVPSSTTVRGYDIRDGSAVWDSGTLSTNDIWTTPAVAANRVFVPSFDGTIRALGPP